ncbi:HAD-IIIC family phosphatase [Leptospira santarosai]|uniref:aminoglycoside N(3)-acetyltransferase n=1 Tax=Leptospira santarosai serovar Shermani str. LT 821 TaxID=758847 RepID=K8Y791_9LEPT|nr:HAD-IIIC family phosphatase [Leptospira santarosai]EKT85630.2 hypothetical protein LSS_16416 [Leptospira santarosai serovar Shermani str. LT 821]EPG82421.1 aminoglycoside 3-N-acetyltransferase [Leptospira santarosai serovar Shermani str. 1342KT]
MISRSSIYKAISDLISNEDQFIVIHSSLVHLKPQNVDIKFELLSVLKKLIGQGKTIAIPTFTFSFCRGKSFHYRNSISEVGLLGSWFLELDGVQRTNHPIYSYAVSGPLSLELLKCKNSTTFGEDSSFALFETLEVRYVMLGCDWKFCTQFHRYEEEANVPYRFFKTFVGKADFGSGEEDISSVMFVRESDLIPAVEMNFSEILDILNAKNLIKKVNMGESEIESTKCSDIAIASRKVLTDNLFGLVNYKESIEYQLKFRNKKSLKIAVLGNANLEFLRSDLINQINTYIKDRTAEVFTVPYGQMRRMIYDQSSELYLFQPEIAIFMDRLEDVYQVSNLDDVVDWEMNHYLINYLDAISFFVSKQSGKVIISSFAIIQDHLLPHISDFVKKANQTLYDWQEKYSTVEIFDLEKAVTLFRVAPVFDPRIWFLGKFVYSYEFTHFLATRLVAILLFILGKSARLIVLDLDNTLWGGVLGEDGVSGIKIGGDYPGNAYISFQKTLKHLTSMGIILALSSKNDEDLAFRVFKERSEMILDNSDIVSHRINWNFKYHSIKEIAEELNLGLENVLFVDDNPVERELMRCKLPQVKVLELPEDPALYSETLLLSPYLQFLSITEEDKRRTQKYKVRKQVETIRKQYENLEDFYESLGLTVHIIPLTDGNISRAEQLINKTNQFNTTTKRYTASQLLGMKENNFGIYIIAVEDKFSELENLGVIIVDWNLNECAVIDDYLLSCRVLGRGIETSVIQWVLLTAKKKRFKSVRGEIINTERNEPVRNIFKDCAFYQDCNSNHWIYEIAEEAIILPKWVTIKDHSEN